MVKLRGYQQEAADVLVTENRFILADEPGLGKTYPAIAAAQSVAPDGRKLVVAPSYLLYQWQQCIWDYAGKAEPVLVVHRNDPVVPKSYTGWVIMSYHTLMTAGVKKHPEILALNWSAVIFDEAHRLRGRKSQWTRTAKNMKANYMWMLTGTPLVNNPGDIWTLLNIMKPSSFRSYWKFVEQWCVLERTPWATIVQGIKEGLGQAYYDAIKPYFMRRSLEDYLDDLPTPETPVFIPVKLAPKVMKAHKQALKEWRIQNPDLKVTLTAASGGALVVMLRRMTAGVLPDAPEAPEKTDTVVDMLSDMSGEPCVVFTWFKDTANLIKQKTERMGRTCYLITGDVDPKEREERIQAWQKSPDGVIIATMASMQEGVNLQRSRRVIFAEHHYLPATMEQAIARVYRSGQLSPVEVYHVIAVGTVDESVWRVMRGRHKNVQHALLEDLYFDELKRNMPTKPDPANPVPEPSAHGLDW